MGEEQGWFHENQNGFRIERDCAQHIISASQVLLGRHKEGKQTFCFFLDVQKAYDTVWRDGLMHTLWETGVRGRMWRLLHNMYQGTKSSIMLDGRTAGMFELDLGLAQGDTLSPVLFNIFINRLMKEAESETQGAGFREEFMFADDFLGMRASASGLQNLIDVARKFVNKWRLKANVSKCAVLVTGSHADSEQWEWMWGQQRIPIVESYKYLGVYLSDKCNWNMHVEETIKKCKRKVSALFPLLSNRNITTSSKIKVIMGMLMPVLEYGSEVWEANKTQLRKLDNIMVKAGRIAIGCKKGVGKEAILHELGLQRPGARMDQKMMEYYSKVDALQDNRKPKMIGLNTIWKNTLRGYQTRLWKQSVIKKAKEYNLSLQDLLGTTPSLITDSILTKELYNIEYSMNHTPNLALLPKMGILIHEMQPYLTGKCGPQALIMFKCRTGSLEVKAVAEEDEDNQCCPLCANCRETVEHFLLQCPNLGVLREEMWTAIQSVVGTENVMQVKSRDVGEQMVFLLGGRVGGEVNRDVLSIVKSFGFKMWSQRGVLALPPSTTTNNTASLHNASGTAHAGREVNGLRTTAES